MKNYSLSMVVIAFPLAVLLHYLLFSRVDMHPTLHAVIGIVLFFMILSVAVLAFKRK